MQSWSMKMGALLFLVGCGGAPFEVGSDVGDGAAVAPDAAGVVDSGDVADALPTESGSEGAPADSGHPVDAPADVIAADVVAVDAAPDVNSTACEGTTSGLLCASTTSPGQFMLGMVSGDALASCQVATTPPKCATCSTYDCACLESTNPCGGVAGGVFYCGPAVGGSPVLIVECGQ